MLPLILNHFSRRTTLIEMLREREVRVGVEVGTDHGKYAQQLLDGIPGMVLYCVDPWMPYVEGTEVHDQENVDQIFNEAKERLKDKNAIILKRTSMEAIKHFGDETLDFVFIDGNHSYPYVLEDITEWAKKVKPGGIVCGHDYKEDPVNDYGVIEAVQQYTKEKHISPWFVLHAGGALVDCWMFIKQP